jgi:hypothetical protein
MHRAQIDAPRFRDWFLNSGDPEAYDVIQLASYECVPGKNMLLLLLLLLCGS